MFAESYITSATQIFKEYTLQLPLSVYLRNYFKSKRNLGSRDRKYIAELMYGIYRLGRQAEHLTVRERLLAGSFLSGKLPLLFFEKTDQVLAGQYHLSFAEKKAFISKHYQMSFKFPFTLTAHISEDEYLDYLFQPSHVFIRIRTNVKRIIAALQKQGVVFTVIHDQCISLPANSKMQDLLPNENEYAIQDYASQLSGEYFNPVAGELWWDCCAASGGKSLLLLDKKVPIDLLVSDIRTSIIQNLQVRFRKYGHNNYQAMVMDVSKPQPSLPLFDKIIADVPCSGAGTWGRSPEQLYFFNAEKLDSFHKLQCSVLQQVLTHLKTDASLYYFTCSVFKEENEEVINSIDSAGYTVVQQKLLKGFQYGGDCLFFCEIKKK